MDRRARAAGAASRALVSGSRGAAGTLDAVLEIGVLHPAAEELAVGGALREAEAGRAAVVAGLLAVGAHGADGADVGAEQLVALEAEVGLDVRRGRDLDAGVGVHDLDVDLVAREAVVVAAAAAGQGVGAELEEVGVAVRREDGDRRGVEQTAEVLDGVRIEAGRVTVRLQLLLLERDAIDAIISGLDVAGRPKEASNNAEGGELAAVCHDCADCSPDPPGQSKCRGTEPAAAREDPRELSPVRVHSTVSVRNAVQPEPPACSPERESAVSKV